MYDIYHAYINYTNLLFAALSGLPVAMQQSFALRRCFLIHLLCITQRENLVLGSGGTLTRIWKGCKQLRQAMILIVNFLGQASHERFHQLFSIRQLKISIITRIRGTVIREVQRVDRLTQAAEMSSTKT